VTKLGKEFMMAKNKDNRPKNNSKNSSSCSSKSSSGMENSMKNTNSQFPDNRPARSGPGGE